MNNDDGKFLGLRESNSLVVKPKTLQHLQGSLGAWNFPLFTCHYFINYNAVFGPNIGQYTLVTEKWE